MKCLLLSICAVLPCVAAASVSMPAIAARLGSHDHVAADARYEVYLPGADTPVVYEVRLYAAAVADSLSPYSYITYWKTPGGGDGFSAYFDGNYYSYDGNSRMLEYHVADDPMPFAPNGNPAAGIQQADRFARLLPRHVADGLIRIAADTAYVYDIAENGGVVCVRGREHRRGYDICEFEYRFADGGARPVSAAIVSSPGQVSEQTVSVTYTPLPDGTECPEISEQTLKSLFPAAFRRYRRGCYSLESLSGCRLPEFTARTITRERYVHDRDAGFAAPAVIAILDYDADSTAAVVAGLRDAVDAMPSACDLILAFTGNDIDRIEELTAPQRAGETILVSARSMARDFGVTVMPSLIFVSRDGTVADIHAGYNNWLGEIVIQKTAKAR